LTFLVTGAAGFIGFHVARALLERGDRVIGVDNLTPCPDPNLKKSRLLLLEQYPGFTLHGLDISQPDTLMALAAREPHIRGIFHFAAQAGVRYSLENPYVFADANVRGHVAVLEMARRLPRLEHLVYASSSSVYGRNNKLPFCTWTFCNIFNEWIYGDFGCDFGFVNRCKCWFSVGLRVFTVRG
jgi:UDP-glucuronate 4-epimerase